MKTCLSFLVLFLVPTVIHAHCSECTLNDVMALNNLIKSIAATVIESAELACIDQLQRSTTATCPAGYTAASCSCGMGCGSWDIKDKTTCHCQCQNMDWTSARCCKIAAKS